LANLLKEFLPPMSEYIDRIANRNYEQPGFILDAGLKDVQLILEAAGEVHVPLPFASVVRDKCLAAQAHGLSQQDWCSFTEIAWLNAGLPRKITN
jgi:3-hydroxyisobutyrate dehydrogenase-like beta-hydroxyacid dehydrogenase